VNRKSQLRTATTKGLPLAEQNKLPRSTRSSAAALKDGEDKGLGPHRGRSAGTAAAGMNSKAKNQGGQAMKKRHT
jgi:hypothetical protein